MPDVSIKGVIVNFPFQPYSVQEEYMAKVIECLQNSVHGVLESPTGTGKTLSLLCSSLSWLLTKKAQLQAQALVGAIEKPEFGGTFFKNLNNDLTEAAGVPDGSSNFGWSTPKIIYASRTHSQLSQAMQELKRTSYKHATAAVLGSRDQLCIHPEVSKETNSSNKIHMCHSKVKSRTCFYYNNVETRKDDPALKQEVLDIEDLVKHGQKYKCCPYFLSRELKQNADITFMPYNYILDGKARKSQGIDLQNNVILLDEAHNVEKMCEEAASLQISSTDIAMCIEEVTVAMQDIANNVEQQTDFLNENAIVQKDFTPEDLCILKTIFLEFESAIDSIEIKKRDEGETYPGSYIFELLGKAQITHGKDQLIIDKLDKVILYLTTTSTSPFSRKGNALQKFCDLLRIVFTNGSAQSNKEKVKQCYKVYIQFEDAKKTQKNDVWESKKSVSKKEGKMICYWCFSPGFSMQQLVDQGVRSVILTSGTLSPLKPFKSELGIPISVELENPHIVKGDQVCVGTLSQGPDGFPLNSSFNTRNDPKYISSLGRTIYNFSCLIPHGLLIFFPSYPIMKKCRDEWQNAGLWTKIADKKPIYVEPQSKDGFINMMNEYYQKINDPACNGAVFMAVCRGKVSEGLDFANANGRAVLITGLPFPPLKDPRVILKQRYLEELRKTDKNGLTGQEWYQLEASRAVNQAIGRIIRHKSDYGAIILCDCRFENANFKKHLSSWLRPHIKKFANFGTITKDLRGFFKYAEYTFPQPNMMSRHVSNNTSLPATSASFDTTTANAQKKVNNGTNERSLMGSGDKFDIATYYKDNESKPNTQAKRKNFSDLMLESTPAINFGNCSLKTTNSTNEFMKKTVAPVAKKRKLRILPMECNPSVSGSSTAVSPSTDNKSVNTVEQKVNEHANTDGDKKALGKAYLKDVKNTLTETDYKIFAKMIQDYTKNSDFETLVKTLEHLFPVHKGFLQLFIGFKSFLKKQHVIGFDEYVHRLKDTSIKRCGQT